MQSHLTRRRVPWLGGFGRASEKPRLSRWCVPPTFDEAERDRSRELITAVAVMPMPTPITPPTIPCASASPAIWRITSRRDQPSARSVPISRTRLATEERVSSAASMIAMAITMIERASAEALGQVGGIDERARDLVGNVLGARDLGAGEGVLDLLLNRSDGRALVGAHEHDVDLVLLAGERL